jgi:serine/threonine-protein kinase
MATVYLACDESQTAAARFVAVKLVHPHLAGDRTFAEMFVDEAELAARIRHPNVCRVYDYDVAGGTPYLAMEYLVGEPFGAVWRKLASARDSDPKRVARLVARMLADACEGLHAAHELTDDEGEPMSVVHRDVSPGNLVLTYEGVAKVVDFGVAAATGKRHRTQTGMLKGKLAYIAPECLRGEKADRRSDLWAIGVVAWELATGERLFRRPGDVETLRAVMDQPIRAPSAVRPGLPKALDAVILRALDRNPAKRHATARELARELMRFATEEQMVTVSELGTWLRELFPGGQQRKEQLLEMAAQMGAPTLADVRRPETTAPTLTAAPVEATPSRLDVRERERALPRPVHRAWAIVAALAVGVLGGVAASWTLTDRSAPLPSVPEPAGQAPIPAPPAPPRPIVEPAPAALHIRPGDGLARGPYVLEVLESASDELVLRVRFEPPREASSAPASTAAARPASEPAPTPRWRRRPADLAAILED